jgi:hypothetical protein
MGYANGFQASFGATSGTAKVRRQQRVEQVLKARAVVDACNESPTRLEHAGHLVQRLTGGEKPRDHAERDHQIKRLVLQIKRVDVALSDLDELADARLGRPCASQIDHRFHRVCGVDSEPSARERDCHSSRTTSNLQHRRAWW